MSATQPEGNHYVIVLTPAQRKRWPTDAALREELAAHALTEAVRLQNSVYILISPKRASVAHAVPGDRQFPARLIHVTVE